MATLIGEAYHKGQRAAYAALIKKLVNNISSKSDMDERMKVYLKIIDSTVKFWGADNTNMEAFHRIRGYFEDPDNRWVRFLNGIIDESHPNCFTTLLTNLGYEGFLRGTKVIRKNREKYGCNIPWLILFDPTDACNLHCVGCWSGTYGHKNNLTYEDMNKIVSQGKELGTYFYMMTGGEPTVRKNDILRLAEEHNDCYFALFSNSTLIDDELCKEVVRLGNISFILSVEGSEETNDARRGEGHYQAAMDAMDLLRKYGIIFGTSICYTRNNIEAVTDTKFIEFLATKGARFGFYFHYMPIGANAAPELMPTMEQRKAIIEKVRWVRKESDIPFFPMDFQNDGEFVGGCIAGGRNYFHINAQGDAEPCVFIHFSDTNIKTHSILEMLQSPLFKAYHEGQPFNRNMLRPCPMLENPELLKEMVDKTGAHGTNAECEETVDELCAKCKEYAAEWATVADELWNKEEHHHKAYENYTAEKRKNPDLAAFEHDDGTVGLELEKMHA